MNTERITHQTKPNAAALLLHAYIDKLYIQPNMDIFLSWEMFIHVQIIVNGGSLVLWKFLALLKFTSFLDPKVCSGLCENRDLFMPSTCFVHTFVKCIGKVFALLVFIFDAEFEVEEVAASYAIIMLVHFTHGELCGGLLSGWMPFFLVMTDGDGGLHGMNFSALHIAVLQSLVYSACPASRLCY